MDYVSPWSLARVRSAALRQMIEAGGRPTAEQVLRAVRPVCGDLLQLGMDLPPSPDDRGPLRILSRHVDRHEARAAAAGGSVDSPACFGTVDEDT